MIATRRNGQAVLQPWNQLFSLRREMADLLDTMNPATGATTAWLPPASVREDADSIHVELELPGVDPSAVDVSLQDRVLTVSGEKHYERRDEEQNWHVHERRFGRFERRFTLGRAFDPDRIEASYDRGVLSIRLPKPEEARPRRIRITTPGNAGGSESGRELGPSAS